MSDESKDKKGQVPDDQPQKDDAPTLPDRDTDLYEYSEDVSIGEAHDHIERRSVDGFENLKPTASDPDPGNLPAADEDSGGGATPSSSADD